MRGRMKDPCCAWHVQIANGHRQPMLARTRHGSVVDKTCMSWGARRWQTIPRNGDGVASDKVQQRERIHTDVSAARGCIRVVTNACSHASCSGVDVPGGQFAAETNLGADSSRIARLSTRAAILRSSGAWRVWTREWCCRPSARRIRRTRCRAGEYCTRTEGDGRADHLVQPTTCACHKVHSICVSHSYDLVLALEDFQTPACSVTLTQF